MRHGRAAFLLAAALMLLAGCGAEGSREGSAASGPSPAAATLLWRELGTWSGRGGRQTESFDVTSGSLRLTWSARSEGDAATGVLRVSLHSAISGRPLQTVVDHVGSGSDTARFTAGPRVAHLLIESSAVDWSVRLEEAVAARAPAPP